MVKKKAFARSDISVPRVEHSIDRLGAIVIPKSALPPPTTRVVYQENSARGHEFGVWYGTGIDELVYACQMQVERFIAKQDADVSPLTVKTYCRALDGLFNFAVMFAAASDGSFGLDRVDRNFIDGYLAFLRAGNTAMTTQKSAYQSTKSVLKALCRRRIIREQLAGDEMTFPENPFPGVHHTAKGQQPLSAREKKAVAVALRAAVAGLFKENVAVTADLLSFALLFVALHTGRNTTPLLEMGIDCLRPHPKDDTMFLVLYKRRGHSTSKVALKNDRTTRLDIESVGAVRPTVVQVIRQVIELTATTRARAAKHLQNLTWVFPMQKSSRGRGGVGHPAVLTESSLGKAVEGLVRAYDLQDINGNPLRLNVSRLRKTFINRVYELLDGDVASTAAAAGNSVQVVDQSYLRPGENSQENWRFMGMALVSELLSGTLGASERTPVGRCSDPEHGEYAPKQGATPCMSFLNCLRCKNYVVTGDDLYRLFSFYWRILSERARMNPKVWQRQLAHIVRIIDRDVVAQGIERGVFKHAVVERERERAKADPHPFWRADGLIAALSGATL